MTTNRTRTRTRTARRVYASVIALALAFAWLLPTAALAQSIEFEDITERTGLAEHLEGWGMGHGGAWGDANNDGTADLYIGAFASKGPYDGDNPPIPNKLFLSTENGFELAQQPALTMEGTRTRTSMALFADWNNSGWLDLLVGTHGNPTREYLFANQGNGQFRDVTPSGSQWPKKYDMRNAAAIDLDQDGLLDLVMVDGAYGGDKQRVVALRNRGNFQFEDVSREYGFPAGNTRGLGTAIGDVNHDGRLDIFVAHSNRLFITKNDGTYTEYRPGFFSQREVEGDDWPCGAAFADLTGNGHLDLVVTLHGQPGEIYLYVNRGTDNNGMPRFEDATREAGLDFQFPRAGKTGMGLKAAQFALTDLDNDGRRDILLGMVRETEQGRKQPVVFRNIGNRGGVPQFDTPPLKSIIGYYATAPVTDYDRDGRVDIFLTNWHEQLNSTLFRNVTDGGNHLLVSVEGKADDLNPMGIGATVRIYAAGHAGDANHLLSRADISIGNGYSSGDEAMEHFGLGDAQRCDVVINWQGREVRRSNVQVNQHLVIPVGGQ